MISLKQCLNTYYDSILGLIKAMPSIFIWKSDTSNTSKKTIKIYNGINWYIEDNENKSRSYKLTQQYDFSSNNEKVIVNNCILMPTNWIGGSELLQVLEVPYQFITVNEYGTCEQIGNWMRFITKNDIDISDLNTIYDRILKSIKDNNNNKINNKHNNVINNKLSNIDYDNCLIRFDIENNNTEIISNPQNYDKGYKTYKSHKSYKSHNTNTNTNYNNKHKTHNKHINNNQYTNRHHQVPISIQLTQ
jgi:hypothetical protein